MPTRRLRFAPSEGGSRQVFSRADRSKKRAPRLARSCAALPNYPPRSRCYRSSTLRKSHRQIPASPRKRVRLSRDYHSVCSRQRQVLCPQVSAVQQPDVSGQTPDVSRWMSASLSRGLRDIDEIAFDKLQKAVRESRSTCPLSLFSSPDLKPMNASKPGGSANSTRKSQSLPLVTPPAARDPNNQARYMKTFPFLSQNWSDFSE